MTEYKLPYCCSDFFREKEARKQQFLLEWSADLSDQMNADWEEIGKGLDRLNYVLEELAKNLSDINKDINN